MNTFFKRFFIFLLFLFSMSSFAHFDHLKEKITFVKELKKSDFHFSFKKRCASFKTKEVCLSKDDFIKVVKFAKHLYQIIKESEDMEVNDIDGSNDKLMSDIRKTAEYISNIEFLDDIGKSIPDKDLKKVKKKVKKVAKENIDDEKLTKIEKLKKLFRNEIERAKGTAKGHKTAIYVAIYELCLIIIMIFFLAPLVAAFIILCVILAILVLAIFIGIIILICLGIISIG